MVTRKVHKLYFTKPEFCLQKSHVYMKQERVRELISTL